MNEREKKVVGKMIGVYCRAKHGTSTGLCDSCNELKTYAFARLDKCLYGEEKPTCSACTVHCYRSDMKARIKEVMRFSGMRMIFLHPVDAVIHFCKERKRKRSFNPAS